MAHSDTFIFLNSITWIFFLFLGLYFFLVTLFLPALYKKVRLHSLVKGAYRWKFSAKLLNFFVVKLVILGGRLPVTHFEFLARRLFSYLTCFFSINGADTFFILRATSFSEIRSYTFKLFF